MRKLSFFSIPVLFSLILLFASFSLGYLNLQQNEELHQKDIEFQKLKQRLNDMHRLQKNLFNQTSDLKNQIASNSHQQPERISKPLVNSNSVKLDYLKKINQQLLLKTEELEAELLKFKNAQLTLQDEKQKKLNALKESLPAEHEGAAEQISRKQPRAQKTSQPYSSRQKNDLDYRSDWTPLHFTAKEGIQILAQRLLLEGHKPDEEDSGKFTPLHVACIHNRLEVAKILLENGAKINSKDKQGNTPLHHAIGASIEMVKLLFNYGAPVDEPNAEGLTPAHMAAREGRLKTLRYLVEIKNADLSATDAQTWSHLHHATLQQKLNVMRYLILQGIKLNAQDFNGQTPLHVSTRFGKTKASLALIQAGALLEIFDHQGKTPLHNTAIQGDLTVLNSILAHGAEINARDLFNQTALHFAVLFNQNSIAKRLIELGINGNITDLYGKTAAHNAAIYGTTQMAEIIVSQNQFTVRKDNFGLYPEQWATLLSRDKVVKIFSESLPANNR